MARTEETEIANVKDVGIPEERPCVELKRAKKKKTQGTQWMHLPADLGAT